MDNKASEAQEKLRQQYDNFPYPNIPLEKTPKNDYALLFLNNFCTSYYLRYQKIIDNEDKIILDAGCGSGYKSLVLAEANPGAKIIGIDISEESVKLARKRLQYHGFENASFYVLPIEDLPSLSMKFDYINSDEVLYLLPAPLEGLRSMKSVLKPEGILRANLHSSMQRLFYFRAQETFKMMGLMDTSPGDLEAELVRETMIALKEQVFLKIQTWNNPAEKDTNWILANPLLQSDKGYTVPEMFSVLKTAGLEFISMVNWRQWKLMDLFKEPDNLPVFLAMSLPDISVEQQLHLFELLHPIHRLLDFWCGHPNQTEPFVPVAEWTAFDWQTAKVHLHPQLRTQAVKEEVVRCTTQFNPFEISKYLPVTGVQSLVDSAVAACLLPLLESAQSIQALVERWQKLRPVHPITLEPTAESEAFEIVRQALTGLEENGYVLLEH